MITYVSLHHYKDPNDDRNFLDLEIVEKDDSGYPQSKLYPLDIDTLVDAVWDEIKQRMSKTSLNTFE